MERLTIVFVAMLWLIAISSVIALSAPHPAEAATFTVNSTDDLVDANPGDGKCETQAGNGVCTLRAATQEANALQEASSIDVPAGTYQLTLSAPCIFRPDSGAYGPFNSTSLCLARDISLVGAGPTRRSSTATNRPRISASRHPSCSSPPTSRPRFRGSLFEGAIIPGPAL
jgi:CSLREA domain-containing protein